MNIIIPGGGPLEIKNILIDYNGTLALDGILIPGVEEILNDLSERFNIHVITADTFGSAGSQLKNVRCSFIRLGDQNQSEAKLRYLNGLGKDITSCIGNGKNDRLMLKESVLGISVIQREGAFTGTVIVSDIVMPDIISALELFRNEKRLIATMRD